MSPTLFHLLEAIGIVAIVYVVSYLYLYFWQRIRAAFTVKMCPVCAKEGRGKVALAYNPGWKRWECRKCLYHERAN